MRHKEGSTLLEFIMVIPCFFVLCLFTVEICLMWADRHLVHLSAFEAARVYAGSSSLSVDSPVQENSWQNQATHDTANPCTSRKKSKLATAAAVQKIAIIAPSLSYLTDTLHLHDQVASTYHESLSNLSRPIRKLLQGWPAASMLTKVECHYRPQTQEVEVQVTYYRHLRTPYVDQAIWVAYNLTRLTGLTRPFEFWLKPDFYGIYGDIDTAQYSARLRDEINQRVRHITDHALGTTEADVLLRQIPGIEALFTSIPSIRLLEESLNAFEQELKTALLPAVSNVSNLLTAALYAVPDSLRVIPMTVQVRLATRPTSSHANESKEPYWQGNIKGVMQLEGAYRKWAQSLSQNKGDLQ